jgi:GTP cyclohydrolase I
MVKVSDISVTSTCEHHFVTIDGTARVAYIPKNKIIGLSKINRIVRFFAQRPQVQERMTQQILVALQTLLETDDVAITIDATHYCVKARGVMDSGSRTQTTALGGIFKAKHKTQGQAQDSRRVSRLISNAIFDYRSAGSRLLRATCRTVVGQTGQVLAAAPTQ